MKIAAIFTACLVAVAFAQTPTAEDYQISGTVVDHLTNRPLNHVLVQIVKTGKGGGDASALTDADGRFSFLHVPTGKYQLLAEKRGQNPQGFHSDGGFSTAIVVDGRQKTDGIVFAMNTDGFINGIVLGDDGEPIRAAQMLLFRESVNDGEAAINQLKGATTNSAGQFHFSHLEPGRYYISAQATPWFNQTTPGAELVYPVTFYGDTTDGNAAKEIVLAEGASTDVQISMHAVPGIRVKLAGGAQGVNLYVAGPGGARISVSPAMIGSAPNLSGRRGGARFAPNASNTQGFGEGGSDGQLELSNLAAGRYQAMVLGGERQNGPNRIGGSFHTVDLSNGSTLNLEPPVASVINGTIIFDGPRPSGDLEVFLGGGPNGMMADVAADGSFKFDKANAGNFGIHLNTSKLVITSVTARGARIVRDNLEVPSGAVVELTIRVGLSESLATIEGYAERDSAGFAGAMVLLLPQDLGRVRLMRRDQSDSDGSFTLASVQPGRYTLVAIDDGKELAYKNESVIKPYLAGGLTVTIPMKSNEPVKVPVQGRLR